MKPHPTMQMVQLEFSVSEYQQVLDAVRRSVKGLGYVMNSPEFDWYWSRLPNYIVARSPFTKEPMSGNLDLQGLTFWTTSPNQYQTVFHEIRPMLPVNCVAVHRFVSLNGRIPDEIPYFENFYDTPFVVSEFLEGPEEAYAVFHALPICRIEGDSFVPSYTVFYLTYYSADTKKAWLRRRQSMEMEAPLASGRAPLLPVDARSPIELDLQYWIRNGKVMWLDVAKPGFALKSGSEAEFPYKIPSETGNERFVVRNGRGFYL